MALKVDIRKKETDVVGTGTIDGIVPFFFKDQGHRWMVRIGQDWILKHKEPSPNSAPSVSSARNKMYWAIAQFRTQSRNRENAAA